MGQPVGQGGNVFLVFDDSGITGTAADGSPDPTDPLNGPADDGLGKEVSIIQWLLQGAENAGSISLSLLPVDEKPSEVIVKVEVQNASPHFTFGFPDREEFMMFFGNIEIRHGPSAG